MCEGEIYNNKWMHCYCAGVPTDHYKLLEESPEPFQCCFCAQRKQAAIIEEMKNTITCLTAEIVELRATLNRVAVLTTKPCHRLELAQWTLLKAKIVLGLKSYEAVEDMELDEDKEGTFAFEEDKHQP